MYDTVASSWGNGSVIVDADGSAMSMEHVAAKLNSLTTQRNHLLTACAAAQEWIDGPGRDVYVSTMTARLVCAQRYCWRSAWPVGRCNVVFKPNEIKPFLALALRLQHEGGLTRQQALRCAIIAWRALRTKKA